jgi:hypothetical protein
MKDVVHSSADDPRHGRAIYTDSGSAETPLVVLGTKGSSKAFNCELKCNCSLSCAKSFCGSASRRGTKSYS